MDEKELYRDSTHNYSKENGSQLRYFKNNIYKCESIMLEECENCGFENKDSAMYCKNCGKEKYTIEENTKLERINSNIKSALKTVIASIIVLFLIAVVYKTLIFNRGLEISKFINPLHILLAMNLGEVDLFTTSMFSATSASLKLGLIVMVIIPIVVISIFNIVFMKKYDKDLKTIAVNSVLVGIMYGGIIGILSIFTKMRINTGDTFMYSGALVYGFGFMSSIINGFVLGFVSTFTVNVFKIKEKLISIELLKLSYKTIGIGIISMMAILTVLSIFNNNYIHDLGLYSYVKELSMPVVLIQLGVYLWAFANLIPVTIGKMSLSLLGISSTNLFFDTKLILVAMLFVSALILIMVGNKIKLKYNSENTTSIKKFSMYYSIIIGVLAILSNIVLVGNGIPSVMMGFEFIIAVIISYIYSFVIALIGYKLS